jgi:hypothetical protein
MSKDSDDEIKTYKSVCYGVLNVLLYGDLSWRDKAILMLCGYDNRFHSQKAIQALGRDGSCSVRNSIYNLTEEGYLIRKEVFTTDEAGNKVGEWKNILSDKAHDLLFPDLSD